MYLLVKCRDSMLTFSLTSFRPPASLANILSPLCVLYNRARDSFIPGKVRKQRDAQKNRAVIRAQSTKRVSMRTFHSLRGFSFRTFHALTASLARDKHTSGASPHVGSLSREATPRCLGDLCRIKVVLVTLILADSLPYLGCC